MLVSGRVFVWEFCGSELFEKNHGLTKIFSLPILRVRFRDLFGMVNSRDPESKVAASDQPNVWG